MEESLKKILLVEDDPNFGRFLKNIYQSTVTK